MDVVNRRRLCEYVTRLVNDHIDSQFVEHGPVWHRAWYELSLCWTNDDAKYVLVDPDRLSEFVELATSKPEVFDLAMFVCGTRLQAGVGIPLPLGTFVGSFLLGKTLRPRGKAGPSRDKNWGRNFIIFAVAEDLRREWDDLPFGENRHQLGQRNRKDRIADILAEGIAQSRLPNLQAEQIQKIYEDNGLREEYSDIMALHYISYLNHDLERI